MSSRASPAEFNPKDWHVDLATDYVTYFPADLGFSVGLLPRDFEVDGLLPEDFVAEPVDFPAWGAIPDDDELARLCRIAAYLYCIRFIARLEKQVALNFKHQPDSEDSIHEIETDITT
jgi:hypothetical protein